jgi:hypothetical protein
MDVDVDAITTLLTDFFLDSLPSLDPWNCLVLAVIFSNLSVFFVSLVPEEKQRKGKWCLFSFLCPRATASGGRPLAVTNVQLFNGCRKWEKQKRSY